MHPDSHHPQFTLRVAQNIEVESNYFLEICP